MKFTLGWLKEHLDTHHPLRSSADKLTIYRALGRTHRGQAQSLFVIPPSRASRKQSSTPMPTGCGCAWSIPGPAIRYRSRAVLRMRAPGMKGVCATRRLHSRQEYDTWRRQDPRRREPHAVPSRTANLGRSPRHHRSAGRQRPVGANYAHWAGLDDPLIEINLTPNRADCTGVHGVATVISPLPTWKIQGHRHQQRSRASFPARSQ